MRIHLLLLCLALVVWTDTSHAQSDVVFHWTGVDPWTRDACLWIAGYRDEFPDPRFLLSDPLQPGEEHAPVVLYGPWEQREFLRCFSIIQMVRLALQSSRVPRSPGPRSVDRRSLDRKGAER